MNFTDMVQFHKFLAPVLIKIVYWIGLFFIGLMTLMGVFGMSMMSRYTGEYQGGFSLSGAILALILGALFTLMWRVACEIWIVIFSINDRLGILTGELPRKSPPLA